MTESIPPFPAPESIPNSYRIFCGKSRQVKNASLNLLTDDTIATPNGIALAIQWSNLTLEPTVRPGKSCPSCHKTISTGDFKHVITVYLPAPKK